MLPIPDIYTHEGSFEKDEDVRNRPMTARVVVTYAR
jgi:hypothetical protein